jgi:hypothetical protein
MVDAKEDSTVLSRRPDEEVEEGLSQPLPREGAGDLARPAVPVESPQGDGATLGGLGGRSAVVGEEKDVELSRGAAAHHREDILPGFGDDPCGIG